MNFLTRTIAFFGRACLSLIFIFGGVAKFYNWQEEEQLLVNKLYDWLTYIPNDSNAHVFLEFLLTWLPLILIVTALFEIFGGLMVLLGIKARLGALLLILCIIPSTLLFHSFWLSPEDQRPLQRTLFMNNLSIFGGILIVLAIGSKGTNTGPIPEFED